MTEVVATEEAVTGAGNGTEVPMTDIGDSICCIILALHIAYTGSLSVTALYQPLNGSHVHADSSVKIIWDLPS